MILLQFHSMFCIFTISLAGRLFPQKSFVHQLSVYDYSMKLYDQNHVTCIAFYNGSCHTCSSFVRAWTQLAYDLRRSSRYLKIAAIDCDVDYNESACRHFKVTSLPEIKYIPEKSPRENVGDHIEVTNTMKELRHRLIHKIQSEQIEGRADVLNNLLPYTEPTISFVAPNGTRYLEAVIFENRDDEENLLGPLAALDFGNVKDYIRIRYSNKNDILSKSFHVIKFPAVMVKNLKYVEEKEQVPYEVLNNRESLYREILQKSGLDEHFIDTEPYE